jgi:hypothetical protein
MKTSRPTSTHLPTLPKKTKVPSKPPTLKPTSSFTPTTAKPQLLPVPSLSPSPKPTRQPSLPRTPSPTNSSASPSFAPSLNTSEFTIIEVTSSGLYYGKDNQNNQFILDGSGNLRITGGAKGVNVYVILPRENTIIIKNFDPSKDVIDLTHFPQFTSLNELTYVAFPLTIVLSNNQQIVFSSANFVFSTNESGTVQGNR